VGGEAQAGSKTSVEKDHWSQHHECSRPEEDRRGAEETLGSPEKGGEGFLNLNPSSN
jgi:hypothetical protein